MTDASGMKSCHGLRHAPTNSSQLGAEILQVGEDQHLRYSRAKDLVDEGEVRAIGPIDVESFQRQTAKLTNRRIARAVLLQFHHTEFRALLYRPFCGNDLDGNILSVRG